MAKKNLLLTYEELKRKKHESEVAWVEDLLLTYEELKRRKTKGHWRF